MLIRKWWNGIDPQAIGFVPMITITNFLKKKHIVRDQYYIYNI